MQFYTRECSASFLSRSGSLHPPTKNGRHEKLEYQVMMVQNQRMSEKLETENFTLNYLTALYWYYIT